MARPRADVGAKLSDALPNGGGADAPGEAPDATGATGTPRKGIPALPTEKTDGSRKLEGQTILLHGPSGIGKSTLASEFPDVMFLECAGELDGLEVFRLPVTSWVEFRGGCAALLEDQAGPKRFKGAVVDTTDALATYVRSASNTKLSIAHESQADWGAGWDAVKNEFVPRMAALSAIPDFGVIWVTHSKTVEIKTRSAAYDRWVPDLPGVIGGPLIKNADLILFMNWNEEEQRVIYTKPDAYHEAKERGTKPMLPEQIEWPLGTNGYQALSSAWGKE